jgi:ribosomal protein S18 acetylase RimI-like enzyme
MNLDQTGFGAFIGERIVGFATVSHHIFGATARYAELVCFQISEEYRRQGIGRKLFSMACEEARRLGAEKLYISSHSSKESQAAYRALGCTPAEEINASLVEEEPFDVQLEYRL